MASQRTAVAFSSRYGNINISSGRVDDSLDDLAVGEAERQASMRPVTLPVEEHADYREQLEGYSPKVCEDNMDRYGRDAREIARVSRLNWYPVTILVKL